MRHIVTAATLAAVAIVGPVQAEGFNVKEEGASPSLKVIVTSPGIYRAEVWQASGGGIMRFHDLVSDPNAKTNLASESAGRGLFEIGWHGAGFKSPSDKKDCCVKHILDAKAGKEKKGGCYDGCRDWPSMGHERLKAQGELEVIEKGPARVRVRAKSVFVWWSKYADRDLPVEAVYTFYPRGRIVIQVRVRRTGSSPMHWSSEYGPHLMLPGHSKKPEADLGFTWSTPKHVNYARAPRPAEELVLASSDKVKTSFMLTIPPWQEKLFSRHMRHNGRGIGWDRSGYGSTGVVMQPGYDDTWACMIQMGTSGSDAVPEMRTAKHALPIAMQYRNPPELTGAKLITDDPGDFNCDGFNESEGCYVLKADGAMAVKFAAGKAPFAPAFKIVGWKGGAPKTISVDGRDVPVVAGAGAVDSAAPNRQTAIFLNAESEQAAKTWSGERVKEHASEGEWSMKKVYGPKKGSLSVYGGFPVWPNDLTPYSHMKLDVYNPQQKPYKLQCAFKDKFMYTHKHYYGMAAPPPWPDGRKITPWAGYVELEVKPGWNRLGYSLDEIAERCGIDWRYIHHYWMWLPELQKSGETATLYFDNMRLVRRPGEAGKLSPEWRKIVPRATEKEKLLYGFESRYELWQWEWSGRKELVAKPGATAGDYGMRVHFGDLGAKKWQYCARFGVRLGTWNKGFERHVWTGYDRLRLDVHNPEAEEREVCISFASVKDKERKEARRLVKVKPGDNSLEFELARLAKDGVDLANVDWFEFKPKRDSKGEFGWMVLDNMRLVND